MKRVQVLESLAGIAFIAFCFVLMNSIHNNKAETLKNREVGKVNQAYTRVVACLASVSPTKRTAEYVGFCYTQAERATNTKITRYGDAIEN